MPATRTIRKSLLWNLILLIVLLGGSIVTVSVVGVRRAVGTLSRALIDGTLDRTESELREFFEPVRRSLLLVKSWGEGGQIRIESTEDMIELFQPVILQHPQISSLIVADERGHEFMLLRRKGGWHVRQTGAEEDLAVKIYTTWEDGEVARRAIRRRDEVGREYNPKTRPWYVGAVEAHKRWVKGGKKVHRGRHHGHGKHRSALADGRDAHDHLSWTDPYVFHTTRQTGITASTMYDGGDGMNYVIAVDVLLEDISAFTMKLEPSERGMAFIVSDKRQVIGLPRHERFNDEAGRREGMLKEPPELGIEVLRDGAAAIEELQANQKMTLDEGIVRIRSEGEYWWAGAKRFDVSPGRYVWIAVAVPEVDVLGDLVYMRWVIISLILIALLVAVWRALAMSRGYSEPMEALVARSDRIAKLDLGEREAVDSHVKEVQALATAQDRMTNALASFSRYVPTEVVRQLVWMGEAAKIGGRSEELSVLFTDIVGFTSIAEGMEPEEVTKHLEEYFDELLRVLQAHRGTIDKMVGDAVMAFWGAPVHDEFHATNGVAAMLAAVNRLDEVNNVWREKGMPVLDTRFGMASGKVMVGNVGSKSRLSYTAIGDTVNLASRIEGVNRMYGTRILVAEGTRESADDLFVYRLVDRVAVKGKKEGVGVYEVMGWKEDVDENAVEFVKVYEEGLGLYQAGKFGEGREVLVGVGERYVRDLSVMRLRGLCERGMEGGVGESWDGVTRLDWK